MTASPPGPDAAPSRALAVLVARLREAGLAPGVEELADTLWLAGQVAERSGARKLRPAEPLPAPGPGGGGSQGGQSVLRPPEPRADTGSTRVPEQARRARLFAPTTGEGEPGGRGVPVRVPAAAVLPDPLGLQRALRPLQRYRPPVRPVPRHLDEQATAERAADTGLLVPVLRHARRRAARLLLLMDISTSTVVWEQALGELRQVCERSGAFREVRVEFLHEGPGGRPGHAATARPGTPLQDPGRLSDPTGSRLTLVLSDCAGPMWRSGRMQRLLHRWGALAPVAVVQPLPQRMWLRTHLPARRGLLHRCEGPAGRLEFEPAGGGHAPGGGVPVPVLALRRSAVEGWAGLVAGSTGQCLEGAAGWALPGHAPSGAPVRARQEVGGAERVRAFKRTASGPAWQLAVYLSAVPPILPVMQLVQRAMLAGSGPEVLAEVLLGGLLRRSERQAEPEVLGYEFLDGVEAALLDHLAEDDVRLLQKHCSDYLERRFGRTVHNFPATAVALLGDAAEPDQPAERGATADHPVLRAFAEVSGEVLRKFLPREPVRVPEPAQGRRGTPDVAPLRERAREAWRSYARKGQARELDRAVGLFEALVQAQTVGGGQAPGADLTELGEALLLRWAVRRDPADLRAALDAAAGRGPHAPRGVLLFGQVLVEVAEEVERAGLGSDVVPAHVREEAAERGGSGRLAVLWAEFILLRDAVIEFGGIAAEAGLDDEADLGWPATRSLAIALGRLAVVAARVVEGGGRIGEADTFRAAGAAGVAGAAGIPAGSGASARAAAGRGQASAGGGGQPSRAPLYRLEHLGSGVATGSGERRGAAGGGGAGDPSGRGPGARRGAADEDAGDLSAPGARPGGGAGELSWLVVRQDDNGNRFRVGRYATRAEAEQVIGSLEERAHRPLGAAPERRADPPPGAVADRRAQDWYEHYMLRAVDAAGTLTEGPDPADGYLLRGRHRLRLARHYDGTGEVARETGLDPRAEVDAHALAGDATDDLRTAVAQGSLEGAELAQTWLDIADALWLSRDDEADEGGRRMVLAALGEALDAAGDDEELTLVCHLRKAEAHWSRYRFTDRADQLQLAVESLESALSRVGVDDPRRAPLLARLGEALVCRGLAEHSAADTDAAVRALREAYESTPGDHPEREEVRMHLAYAYVERFRVQEVLADLYEADWILSAIVRTLRRVRPVQPHLLPVSWLKRGEVATLLSARTDSLDQLRQAAEYYSRAAGAAAEAGYGDIQAEALQSRGEVLEQLDDPEAALDSYRRALVRHGEAGADPARVQELAAAVTRLEELLGGHA
ncbi:SAV_2336 N-terminal domain-related protein [Streptomyces sp. NPDC059009]|uniref:SAV_2336 N-terminal domain-related protein n=1 Tax=Streptomyces sp. NPDC059009 TaxID=3346694 RepID=UPI0036A17B8A